MIEATKTERDEALPELLMTKERVMLSCIKKIKGLKLRSHNSKTFTQTVLDLYL